MPITLNGDTGITTPTYGGIDTSEYLVPVTGFKNRLINGSMAVWQRGTSFSLSAGQTYTADRWITVISGSGSTSTISQQATTPAELTSFEMQNPQFYLRYAVTTAGSVTYRDLAQRIEDVRTFAGQNVTVSFYAKAASSMTVGVQMYQGFGSGGSADTSTTPVNVTIGTSWQRYTVTIACPSISGKTVGAGSMVATVFIMPNSTFTFDLALVQSEYGSTATSFDYRPYGTELQLCQRYCVAINPNIAVEGFTNTVLIPIYNTVSFRAAPTITVPYTDASFTSSGSPSSTQWGLQTIGIAAASKTGTITFNSISLSTSNLYGIYMTGATFSIATNWIAAGSSIPNIVASAEL